MMNYEAFGDGFLALAGIDLHGYKEKQMKRRINTLMEREKYPDYEAFLEALAADPEKLRRFKEYVTINVTEFFRTPDHWAYFENEALPELVRRRGEMLKVWCAACSTGEEPYSVAMSLRRLLPAERIRVLATDLDESCLAAAGKGIYGERTMNNVPPELLEHCFEQTGGKWRISEEIRSCVEFRKLDLLRDPYPEDCDLIVCRNVLIYFTEEAKEEICLKFRQSLREGGYLFTGNTEQIIFYKKFGLNREKTFLYRK